MQAKLTPKQRKFCEVYAANGGNATAAARDVGYKQSQVQGAQNLAKPSVADYIKTLTKDEQKDRIATAVERQQFWSAIMRGEILDRDEPASLNDRVKASEILGKSQGDFLTKVELTGKDGAEFKGIEVNFVIPKSDEAG